MAPGSIALNYCWKFPLLSWQKQWGHNSSNFQSSMPLLASGRSRKWLPVQWKRSMDSNTPSFPTHRGMIRSNAATTIQCWYCWMHCPSRAIASIPPAPTPTTSNQLNGSLSKHWSLLTRYRRLIRKCHITNPCPLQYWQRFSRHTSQPLITKPTITTSNLLPVLARYVIIPMQFPCIF